MAALASRKFRIGLCQLLCGADKAANITTARKAVAEASVKGAQVVVLPECFNSPYGTQYFAEYAEAIPESSAKATEKEHPTTFSLVSMAKEHGVWLVGGSFPEKTGDGKIYNTCLCLSPEGEIVAKHRKVHLFDIDIPGGGSWLGTSTSAACMPPSYVSSAQLPSRPLSSRPVSSHPAFRHQVYGIRRPLSGRISNDI